MMIMISCLLTRINTPSAKKPFNVGEKLVWIASKDNCQEILGQATVEKTISVPAWLT